jgi:hypothetical protein
MDRDPDPAPDPTLDQTPFFQDAKKIHLFFFKLTRRHIIFGLKNLFFCENFVLKFYFASIISFRSTLL